MSLRTDLQQIHCYRMAIGAARTMQELQDIAEDMIGHRDGMEDIASQVAYLLGYCAEWETSIRALDA